MPKETIIPFTILIDNREKALYRFEGIKGDAKDGGGILKVPTERATLKTGDYSLKGFEPFCAIERKSLPDLYNTLATRREQFREEFKRLSYMHFSCVIVEASWGDIARGLQGEHGSRILPKTVFRTIVFWSSLHRVPVFAMENRDLAERAAFRLLRYWWKKLQKKHPLAPGKEE